MVRWENSFSSPICLSFLVSFGNSDPTLTSFNSFIVHIKMSVGRMIVFLNNKEAAESYYLAYIHIKAPNVELLKMDSSRSHNISKRSFSTVLLLIVSDICTITEHVRKKLESLPYKVRPMACHRIFASPMPPLQRSWRTRVLSLLVCDVVPMMTPQAAAK